MGPSILVCGREIRVGVSAQVSLFSLAYGKGEPLVDSHAADVAIKPVMSDPPPRRQVLLKCKTLSAGGVGQGSSTSSTHVSIQTTHTTERSTYSLQPSAGAPLTCPFSPAPRPRPHPPHHLQSSGRERVNLLSRCSQAKRAGEGWISRQVSVWRVCMVCSCLHLSPNP